MSGLNRTIERLFATPIDQIDKKLASAKVVSFDVFDTLVKRNVRRPSDVFHLLERELLDEFGQSQAAGFAEKRVRAEAIAREAKGVAEVTLDEIYDLMGFAKEVRVWAQRRECELEVRLAMPNRPMLKVLNKCQARGQRVVIISDIYLPRYVMEELLKKCGVTGYERLFISCEGGSTKRSGTLFAEAFAEIGVDSGDVMHVGDSLVSDYLNPRKVGARSILVDRETRTSDEFAAVLGRCGSLDAGMVSSLISNAGPGGADYYAFGYECFGPYLLGFSKWLEESVEREGIEKVYFLSRDGYILKRAFEILYPDRGGCEYLEVSRRSLRIPMLGELETTQQVVDVMPPSQEVSVADIFDSLGLRLEGREELLQSLGLSADEAINKHELSTDVRVSRLIEALRPEFSKASEAQFDALEDYLATIGVGGRFAIVDIGWSGGMQRYLEDALRRMGISCEVSGYYTGIVAYATRNVRYAPLKLNGYVFDCLRDGPQADIRRFYVGFLETLFLEQDGTVVGYGTDDAGKPVALRGDYEYADGKGGALYEAGDVKELQEGALDFLRDAVSSGVASFARLTPKEAFCGIDAAGANPTRHILDMFAGFRFFDDGKVSRLAAPERLRYYLVRPGQLKKDFLASRWKVAFAKLLLHGFPLQYRDILSMVAKGGE